ncbi:MAG: hypothetical protein EON58_18955 [Alphaproteobacteria bacterium]|nr:MAG: hypothetical protein EON58_18955 [Alphaproteobacteria bacterium]
MDENLSSFWDATKQPNIMLRFIFYYRIIEYAGANFFSGDVRSKLTRILSNPTVCAPNNVERSVSQIIAAFDGLQADEVARFNAMITTSVKPEVVWREIENNKALFIDTVTFDGGYVLQNIISREETLKTFSGG